MPLGGRRGSAHHQKVCAIPRVAVVIGSILLTAALSSCSERLGPTTLPACAPSASRVTFDRIVVGECSGDTTLTVTNTGGGVLEGTVGVSAEDFEIVRGRGRYTLGAGESRAIDVRFCPQGSGDRIGFVSFGSTDCGQVSLTGEGEAQSQCRLSATSLDLGGAAPGECSTPLEFTITNNGGATLEGAVSETCPEFEVTAGAGPYVLAAGQSRTVGVRFCPTSQGEKSCTIATGAPDCGAVTATGTGAPQPACRFVPATGLAFGPVAVGQCSVREFTITNTGGGHLTGTLAETCPDFEIVSGGGAFSLGAGQSRIVAVRFCPQGAGEVSCTITTGSPGCEGIVCSGVGDPPPAPQVAPATIGFGSVLLGQCSEVRQLTITNIGGGTLTGTASEACPEFEIVSGDGPYSLTAGQSRTVGVRFCPQGPGDRSCVIETGHPGSVVTCTGTGDAVPACGIAPGALGFGAVVAGQCSDTRTFTITNTRVGTLSGTVSETCPDFEITAGAGPYSLASGQSHTVSVRFCPVSEGEKNCVIETGSDACADVAVSGTGQPPPACELVPASLAFARTTVGTCSEGQELAIVNTGGGTLTGSVSEACPDFEIVSGGGPYSLGAGQSRIVVVRFCPQSPGDKTCAIETGNPACRAVTATGVAEPPATCLATPGSLAYGTLMVGQCSPVRQFALINSGGGTLSGEVSETCPDFEIVSGAGPYTLTAGQSRIVGVRFCPQTPGDKTCVIETGAAACADITCSGTGEPQPACGIVPTSIPFDTVVAGECSAPQQVLITNTGGGVLTGTVSESCPDFEIVSGAGPYSLTAGQSHTISVRFCPQSPGEKTCTIATGNAGCPAVTCSGFADRPPAGQVVPASIDFGAVGVGRCSGQVQFAIVNSGGGTLTGTVSEPCPDFEIVAGAGPYSLAAGQSHTVEVRFCPRAAGDATCTIDTGSPRCPDVSCTGTGEFVFLKLGFSGASGGWCYSTNHPGIARDGVLYVRECQSCDLSLEVDPRDPCSGRGSASIQGQLMDSYFWPTQKGPKDLLEEEGVDIDPATTQVIVTWDGYTSPPAVVRYLVATETEGCRQSVPGNLGGGCDRLSRTVASGCIREGSRVNLRVGKMADFINGRASFSQITFQFVGWSPADPTRIEVCYPPGPQAREGPVGLSETRPR